MWCNFLESIIIFLAILTLVDIHFYGVAFTKASTKCNIFFMNPEDLSKSLKVDAFGPLEEVLSLLSLSNISEKYDFLSKSF